MNRVSGVTVGMYVCEMGVDLSLPFCRTGLSTEVCPDGDD